MGANVPRSWSNGPEKLLSPVAWDDAMSVCVWWTLGWGLTVLTPGHPAEQGGLCWVSWGGPGAWGEIGGRMGTVPSLDRLLLNLGWLPTEFRAQSCLVFCSYSTEVPV